MAFSPDGQRLASASDGRDGEGVGRPAAGRRAGKTRPNPTLRNLAATPPWRPTLLSKLLWWPAPVNTTTFNVAFQPKQVIGQTLDYVSKLGWAIAAGPGNSPDEIGADMAFSFIPVVGVYSDIRDSAAELLKLWPGGESPDWTAFGFAVVGILTEITPADVALDVAKGFVKAAKANIINPTGVLFKTVITEFKTLGPRVVSAAGQSASAVLKEVQDTVNFISGTGCPRCGAAPAR